MLQPTQPGQPWINSSSRGTYVYYYLLFAFSDLSLPNIELILVIRESFSWLLTDKPARPTRK
jgi:hypothetical protein